ncbi:MAG TPA: hypothetical protein VNT81_09350 [Vicinamibacterales bacterium]|nr:hypothetical protein [Vicinamibacterales bacterium]
MPARVRLVGVILAFNAALALLLMAGAPEQPKLSDRAEYDFNSRTPLQAFCPNTIYCYRVLVPMLLERVPADPEFRWRAHQWLAHTLTGTTVGIVTAGFASPFIASALLQTSYAFTFTAYDPYTPDPFVFLIAAVLLYCWMHARALLVACVVAVAVFAKETVALLASVPAIAVFLNRERSKAAWFLPAVIAWSILLGFHWYMDTYFGWGISRNPAANFATGSWLAIWWQNNPFLARKALIVFSPFGFAWIFAALGYRHAPVLLRQLALGAILPMLALVYVQTPERALGNAFFVIVPLAAIFLARASSAAAWAAVVTNGLLTARIGLSSDWLPGTAILLGPALIASAWAIASARSAPVSTRDRLAT